MSNTRHVKEEKSPSTNNYTFSSQALFGTQSGQSKISLGTDPDYEIISGVNLAPPRLPVKKSDVGIDDIQSRTAKAKHLESLLSKRSSTINVATRDLNNEETTSLSQGSTTRLGPGEHPRINDAIHDPSAKNTIENIVSKGDKSNPRSYLHNGSFDAYDLKSFNYDVTFGQTKLLQRADVWFHPEVGKRFVTSNIPIEILNTMKKVFQERSKITSSKHSSFPNHTSIPERERVLPADSITSSPEEPIPWSPSPDCDKRRLGDLPPDSSAPIPENDPKRIHKVPTRSANKVAPSPLPNSSPQDLGNTHKEKNFVLKQEPISENYFKTADDGPHNPDSGKEHSHTLTNEMSPAPSSSSLSDMEVGAPYAYEGISMGYPESPLQSPHGVRDKQQVHSTHNSRDSARLEVLQTPNKEVQSASGTEPRADIGFSHDTYDITSSNNIATSSESRVPATFSNISDMSKHGRTDELRQSQTTEDVLLDSPASLQRQYREDFPFVSPAILEPVPRQRQSSDTKKSNIEASSAMPGLPSPQDEKKEDSRAGSLKRVADVAVVSDTPNRARKRQRIDESQQQKANTRHLSPDSEPGNARDEVIARDEGSSTISLHQLGLVTSPKEVQVSSEINACASPNLVSSKSPTSLKSRQLVPSPSNEPPPVIITRSPHESAKPNSRRDSSVSSIVDVRSILRPGTDIFTSFKNTYTKYTGDEKHFMGVCRMIWKMHAEGSMLHPSLWDDFVIKHKIEYSAYTIRCIEGGTDPLPYAGFFYEFIEEPQRLNNVVSKDSIQTLIQPFQSRSRDFQQSMPPSRSSSFANLIDHRHTSGSSIHSGGLSETNQNARMQELVRPTETVIEKHAYIPQSTSAQLHESSYGLDTESRSLSLHESVTPLRRNERLEVEKEVDGSKAAGTFVKMLHPQGPTDVSKSQDFSKEDHLTSQESTENPDPDARKDSYMEMASKRRERSDPAQSPVVQQMFLPKEVTTGRKTVPAQPNVKSQPSKNLLHNGNSSLHTLSPPSSAAMQPVVDSEIEPGISGISSMSKTMISQKTETETTNKNKNSSETKTRESKVRNVKRMPKKAQNLGRSEPPQSQEWWKDEVTPFKEYARNYATLKSIGGVLGQANAHDQHTELLTGHHHSINVLRWNLS